MAAISITSPTTGTPPATSTAHPHAKIITDNGKALTMHYAPREADLGGWSATFDSMPRPGRRPLLVRTADRSLTANITFMLAHQDHRHDIERDLAVLKSIGAWGARVTLVNMSPQEAGPWRITDMSVAGQLRQPGTNRITRAIVTLTLAEVSDPTYSLGPRYRRRRLKKSFYFRAKKGMTPRKQAHKYYGDPGLWKVITKANRMKTAKFKVGKKYKMPAYRP